MGKIKAKIHALFSRNIHHIQELLFAVALIFIVGGFIFANAGEGGAQLKALILDEFQPRTELLSADSTLFLPKEEDAPENAVKFSEGDIGKWSDNDKLLENIFQKTLVARILEIAKYILGGIFMLFLGLYVLNFLMSGDKQKASEEFNDQILWAFIGFLILAIAEPFSQAFTLLRDGGQVDLLTDPEAALASANIVGFTYRSAAHLIEYVLGGIALLTMGASVFQMITAGGDEEEVSSARKSLAWSAIALIIVGGAALFVDKVLAPPETITKQLEGGLDPGLQLMEILKSGQSQARIVILNYVKYFQTFIGAGAVLMLFLAGFKMVSASGEEDVITKQRKMITWIFMGLAIILIAEAFVNVFMPDVGGEIQFSSATAIQSFSAQMGGFTNFLLTFTAAVAVLALIVGALYTTTAFANPEQAEKGKKIILAAALGLIVTISAYAIVNTILSSGSAGAGISISI
ncbi:MAG: hypothetical protein K9L85_00585 [Candidatus Peribacteraceae bacterium]|nr:hypothetical protein [Candidatus Peribacteraceae bacterium]